MTVEPPPAPGIPSEGAVSVRGLVKDYGNREALRGIDLDIPHGCCFGLFGPNGSGKTTLFKIITGLIQPTRGQVSVAGFRYPKHCVKARAHLGVLLDQPLLPLELTLREALQYTADLYRLHDARARIDELLDRVGLTWRVRDPIRSFSRGMAQRVSLICALLPDPDILILDEPFTGLDSKACDIVEEEVVRHRARGKTVLLVTHEIDRAARLFDAVAVLQKGTLAFLGEPGKWTRDDLLSVYAGGDARV